VQGTYAMTSKRSDGLLLHSNIKPGLYQNVGEILDEIHKQIKDYYKFAFSEDPKTYNFFSYRINTITQKLEIKISEDEGQIILYSDDLKAILGYNSNTALNGIIYNKEHRNNEDWIQAQYPVDIQRLHTLLVYTDIIEHQIVGDTNAPLLRSIALTSKIKNSSIAANDDVQITKEFNEPLQFKKLQVNTFRSIHIDLFHM